MYKDIGDMQTYKEVAYFIGLKKVLKHLHFFTK